MTYFCVTACDTPMAKIKIVMASYNGAVVCLQGCSGTLTRSLPLTVGWLERIDPQTAACLLQGERGVLSETPTEQVTNKAGSLWDVLVWTHMQKNKEIKSLKNKSLWLKTTDQYVHWMVWSLIRQRYCYLCFLKGKNKTKEANGYQSEKLLIHKTPYLLFYAVCPRKKLIIKSLLYHIIAYICRGLILRVHCIFFRLSPSLLTGNILLYTTSTSRSKQTVLYTPVVSWLLFLAALLPWLINLVGGKIF